MSSTRPTNAHASTSSLKPSRPTDFLTLSPADHASCPAPTTSASQQTDSTLLATSASSPITDTPNYGSPANDLLPTDSTTTTTTSTTATAATPAAMLQHKRRSSSSSSVDSSGSSAASGLKRFLKLGEGMGDWAESVEE